MPTRFTAATTRTATAPPRRIERETLLSIRQIIVSPETGLRYQIERLLGQGGFGQAYLARRMGPPDGSKREVRTRWVRPPSGPERAKRGKSRWAPAEGLREDNGRSPVVGFSELVPETVCVKVSQRIDGWLREAYFGQLLDGHPRAIRVFDAFPLPRPDRSILYCLALEYAAHGDLSAFLRRHDRPWTESVARREIAGVLEVLGKLHRGQLLHRDLTPMNVFVCDNRRLKLGDFGIVRQQSDQRGITARTMNTLTAPSEFLAGGAPKWQARDDVYQVGQLLAMLVKGNATTRIRTSEVRALACSDHLKEIIHRCIGERRKRYESADELIDALRTPPASLKAGALRSLKGVHLTFTGILSKPRTEAALAARKAGAIVHGGPSTRTTVIVRGRPNPLQAAGRDGGLKLMEIKRLREKGHTITLLDEAQFWRLVKQGTRN